MRLAVLFAGVSSALGLVYSQLLVKLLTSLSSDFLLSQTIVLAVYITSMGVGAYFADRAKETSLARRLPDLQLAASVVGLSAVFWVYAIYFVYKFYFLEISDPRIHGELSKFVWILTSGSQPVVAAIGGLAGLELNLLLRLGQSSWPKSGAGLILSAGYIGTAGASLVFIWILPMLTTSAAFFSLATANVCFAIALTWVFAEPTARTTRLAIGMAVAVSLGICIQFAPDIEQFEAKAREIQGLQVMRIWDLPKVFKILNHRPMILRHNTGYQIADFSFQSDGGFHFLLDHHAQIESSWLHIYHEGLIDIPIQLFRRVPEQVLILGGGDGVAAGQLFRYGNRIKNIDLVDLDPWMLSTAANHVFFKDLNRSSYQDPRLRVKNLDAIQVLRAGTSLYDAAIIDFPLPYEAELTKLYTREFYAMVASRLKPDGMLIMDTPLGCYRTDSLERGAGQWRNHSRTSLKAAGLHNITAYCSGDGFLIARKDSQEPHKTLEDMGVSYKWLTPKTFAAALGPVLPRSSAAAPSSNTIFKPNRPLRAREM